MFRAFLGELGHLVLDYTRVDSIARGSTRSWTNPPAAGHTIGPDAVVWCCRTPAAAPQDLQATRERQPVDIEILPLGRLQHQCSHHEVAKRQGVQLLLHTLRRLAAPMRWAWLGAGDPGASSARQRRVLLPNAHGSSTQGLRTTFQSLRTTFSCVFGDCSKDTGLSHHAALALCRVLVVWERPWACCSRSRSSASRPSIARCVRTRYTVFCILR